MVLSTKMQTNYSRLKYRCSHVDSGGELCAPLHQKFYWAADELGNQVPMQDVMEEKVVLSISIDILMCRCARREWIRRHLCRQVAPDYVWSVAHQFHIADRSKFLIVCVVCISLPCVSTEYETR